MIRLDKKKHYVLFIGLYAIASLVVYLILKEYNWLMNAIVCLFCSIIKEATQAERDLALNSWETIKRDVPIFFSRFFSKDSCGDFIADFSGIATGILIGYCILHHGLLFLRV